MPSPEHIKNEIGSQYAVPGNSVFFGAWSCRQRPKAPRRANGGKAAVSPHTHAPPTPPAPPHPSPLTAATTATVMGYDGNRHFCCPPRRTHALPPLIPPPPTVLWSGVWRTTVVRRTFFSDF